MGHDSGGAEDVYGRTGKNRPIIVPPLAKATKVLHCRPMIRDPRTTPEWSRPEIIRASIDLLYELRSIRESERADGTNVTGTIAPSASPELSAITQQLADMRAQCPRQVEGILTLAIGIVESGKPLIREDLRIWVQREILKDPRH